MSDALSPAQVGALASDLRSVLGRIEAGDLVATTPMKYRIEGAVVALEVVQGMVKRFEPEAY